MRLAPIEAAVFAPVRGLLRLRARDITVKAAGRTALVIAPHADDETLGCGATIARKRAAGRAVHVVIVTDGRRSHDSAKVSVEQLIELRREEAVNACAVLGVPRADVSFLAVEDQRVGEHSTETARQLAELIARLKPDEVYSPIGIDRNPDHQALGDLMHGLVRDRRVTCPVLEYPVWFWTLRTWAGRGPMTGASYARLASGPARATLLRRPRVVSTDGYLDIKRRALAQHRSQMENLTGEADWGVLPPEFVEGFFGPYELFFEMAGPATPVGGAA